jgi:DNA-binding MarR family transcriptional regulator
VDSHARVLPALEGTDVGRVGSVRGAGRVSTRRPIHCFVLTKRPAAARLTAVTIDTAISLVQFCYPQVYYACHTRHERKRSSALRLSRRDSELLVHLDRSRPAALTDVARHMDLAPSTVSEAVTKLEALGYLQKAPASTGDRRRIGLVLTAKGVEAVHATSVLEPARLRGVLKRLSKRQLAAVTDGLTILAEACRPAARPERGARESPSGARPERVARKSRPERRGWGPGALRKT